VNGPGRHRDLAQRATQREAADKYGVDRSAVVSICILIARLAVQLRCYEPERPDEGWSRLRHLGVRRVRLLSDSVACSHQVRDLLECVWPAVLNAAAYPFKSATWLAALHVMLTRCAGDPRRLRRLGLARFSDAVRNELSRWGASRLCQLAGPAGTAVGRAQGVRGDWVYGTVGKTGSQSPAVPAKSKGAPQPLSVSNAALWNLRTNQVTEVVGDRVGAVTSTGQSLVNTNDGKAALRGADGGMRPLPNLTENGRSSGAAMSEDGVSIAGMSADDTRSPQPVRWHC
jgi:hypothetical protein